MAHSDQYKAYGESSILCADPAALVVALYEGGIEAVCRAKACLQAGDISGRGKEITKAVNIVTELLVSLDHKRGGDLSRRLEQLYLYLHKRLLEAHAGQNREALDEVRNLLETLLVGWHKVAADSAGASSECKQPTVAAPTVNFSQPFYGHYLDEPAEVAPGFSAAF